MTRVLTLLIGVVLLSLPPVAASAVDDVTFEPGTGFSAAQQREIRQQVATATIPVTVRAVTTLPKRASGSPRVYAEKLAADLWAEGEEGVVVVFSPDTLPAYGAFESREEPTLGAAQVALRKMGLDPHRGFVRLVEMLVHGNGHQVMEEQLAEQFRTGDAGGDSGGAFGDDASTPVMAARWLIIGGAILVVGLLVWLRGRAVLAWWRRRRRTAGLEQAATRAREVNLADQAKADLLAFGAEIDAEKMDEHDSLKLWQLALDDYHEASTLYDRRSGPQDDEKVIRLCAQGRERLRSAQR